MTENKYGEISNAIKEIFDKAKAEWTSEGWIVPGNLYLSGLYLTRLPLIKEVGGSFYCDNNELTTFEGCPQIVGGSFYCSNNKLTSLKGAPKEVGGNFDCNNNQLISLEGCPQIVGGSFIAVLID